MDNKLIICSNCNHNTFDTAKMKCSYCGYKKTLEDIPIQPVFGSVNVPTKKSKRNAMRLNVTIATNIGSSKNIDIDPLSDSPSVKCNTVSLSKKATQSPSTQTVVTPDTLKREPLESNVLPTVKSTPPNNTIQNDNNHEPVKKENTFSSIKQKKIDVQESQEPTSSSPSQKKKMKKSDSRIRNKNNILLEFVSSLQLYLKEANDHSEKIIDVEIDFNSDGYFDDKEYIPGETSIMTKSELLRVLVIAAFILGFSIFMIYYI